jgi:hypothetical protein
MCIIVAKYFPGIGWAGAKNRDRKYIPTLDFIEDEVDGVQRMMMHDQITGYKEGLNNHGVSILNTSLDILNDETDVESGKVKSSPDGKFIEEALLNKDPLDAVKHLVKRKLVGCTIVFNAEDCYLIEASDQDGTKPYEYIVKKIGKNKAIARTNHGIYLQWASFQRDSKNKQEVLDRISSESRLLQAEAVVDSAQRPEDLVDGLCKVFVKHPQLNIMRFSTGKDQFRTTSQQLCVPKEKTLYCRPVSSNLQFDFWKLNKPNTNVWVEILNNRELWQKTSKPKPFAKMDMKDTDAGK